MLFSSLIFLLFFLPLFFLCYFAAKKRAARNAILFAFSLFFYAWGEPLYVLLMLLSLAANYVFGRVISSAKANAQMLIIASARASARILFIENPPCVFYILTLYIGY